MPPTGVTVRVVVVVLDDGVRSSRETLMQPLRVVRTRVNTARMAMVDFFMGTGWFLPNLRASRGERPYARPPFPAIHPPGRPPTIAVGMNAFLILAILLAVAWFVLRVALAVTGAALHLLWILAIIFFVVWLIRKIAGK